jgi:hypothetical protein
MFFCNAAATNNSKSSHGLKNNGLKTKPRLYVVKDGACSSNSKYGLEITAAVGINAAIGFGVFTFK